MCITASAKAENQYPEVTLTLNDSTVVTGYLRSNLHDVGSKVAISETGDSKKMSYKIADIHSLEVTYPDRQAETYIPIHTWDKYSKKANKNPVLATVCDIRQSHCRISHAKSVHKKLCCSSIIEFSELFMEI